ncbi:MAG: RNase adapter RapZ [Alphaproteobacteria bacterium]|nr:RNase adapter RapZ [Alphaproteobacteria bacterium]HPF47322.1 RNase adapter RapZ [Emcibacteraceae bacterium]
MRKKSNILNLLLITGMSGAGKSTALSVLEDLEYEAIDNLPINLLPSLIDLAMKNDPDHANPALAIGVDARTRNFQPENIVKVLSRIKEQERIAIKILYFDSGDEVLSARFSETRRRHPLAKDRPVSDGIARERQMMEVIKAQSDYIFDTSEYSIHDLRRVLSQHFERGQDKGLSISVSSFAYPKGLPRDADLVFDVRFLRNPHYDETLKAKTGREEIVGEYIMRDPVFNSSWDKISSLILTLLPEYKKEGKSYLTISFGCTGGKHRSVFLAEKLGALLKEKNYQVNIHHRELSL